MGNLCGKESSSDAFSQPGRTLSSANPPSAPQNQTSSVPKKVVVGGPARTLGSSPTPGQGQSSSAQEDARRKAAEAAEARANATNKPKGKLGSQLQEQKKQTRSDTLEGLSKEERRLRDADAGAEARAYN